MTLRAKSIATTAADAGVADAIAMTVADAVAVA
jgi:hypothetical protein